MVTDRKIELIKFHDILTHETLENILKDVKKVCTQEGESRSKIRKIYSVAVELLDNSYMHTEIYKFSDLSVDFKLTNQNDNYIIEIRNIIANKNIKKLEERLEILSTKSKIELRELYKIKIINSQISDKGGAGIGLIDIARKAENKLDYQFDRINRLKSYFTLKIKVK